MPIWPIWPNFEVNGLDWRCCLAGSSKTAPRIFNSLIVLGAEYSSYVKSIATYALTFFWYIISILASVMFVRSVGNVDIFRPLYIFSFTSFDKKNLTPSGLSIYKLMKNYVVWLRTCLFFTQLTVAQSISTHYSCFENQGRFVTLKKNRAPDFLKKAAWSLLFLNNNDPVFLRKAGSPIF